MAVAPPHFVRQEGFITFSHNDKSYVVFPSHSDHRNIQRFLNAGNEKQRAKWEQRLPDVSALLGADGVSPTDYSRDTHGGRHEEGGMVVMHPAGTELVWAAPGPTIDPDAVAEVPIYAGWSGISNSSHQLSLTPAARNRLQALGMPPPRPGGPVSSTHRTGTPSWDLTIRSISTRPRTSSR